MNRPTDERPPDDGAGERPQRTAGMRFGNMGAYGRGFEFVAAVIGMAAFGYWIGGTWDRALHGLAIGGILGIVGGMYNLLRQGLGATRRAEANRGKSEK